MLLELDHISKIYGDLRAVDDLNLTVPEGEWLAIVGSSGSGKTTLMNIIGCLDEPTSGSYLLGGRDITQCTNKQLAEVRNKELGFVFQSFNLLPKLTALDNVALPLLYGGVKKAERLERARAALETVGLSDRVDHRPDQLSGGQCQRVAIARAIVGKPKLLLADEPTGAVDRKTADDILEMFRKLNEKLGLTIVIVTHDKELAKKVNRVVSIRDGKTSSERIMKNDYRERMEHLDIDWQEEETQEEFAVLDRAGRVQIPSELLEQMGMDGNKVKLEFIGGKIVIEKPKD